MGRVHFWGELADGDTSRDQAQQWIYCLYNSLTRINNTTHSLVKPVYSI